MSCRKLLYIAASVLLATSVTGCSSIFQRDRGYKEEVYTVTEFSSRSEFSDGSFYIQHGKKYSVPYIGDRTFSLKDEISVSPYRIAWFGKDYDCIPTMHKGDRLLYYSTSEFSPSFTFERFQNLGYTVGICGITQRETGDYGFSSDSDALQIALNSDAGVLYQLGEHVVKIRSIGGTKLGPGNISKSGTILGLQKEKIYELELYVGTELKKYRFAADVQPFVSSEAYIFTNFDFHKDGTIEVILPDTLQSGYYNIANRGIFRYINSADEFTEDMDMNIPNTFMAEEESAPFDNSESFKFTIEKGGEHTVTVSVIGEAAPTSPKVRIVGEEAIYTLNPAEDGTSLTGTFDLPKGEYTVEITGLLGRLYTYSID